MLTPQACTDLSIRDLRSVAHSTAAVQSIGVCTRHGSFSVSVWGSVNSRASVSHWQAAFRENRIVRIFVERDTIEKVLAHSERKEGFGESR